MSDLIDEYKLDLKILREQHRKIAAKKIQSKHKVLGKTQVKVDDQRTADEKVQQRILASMISSTEYALQWLQSGHEKRQPDNTSIPKRLREQLWADVDGCIKWRNSKNVESLLWEDSKKKERNSEKKNLQTEQVNEIVSTFSDREKELFLLKYTAMLTEEECAEKMDITVGTVKSMSQRIRDKIECYFEYGHQMQLF